MTRASRTCPVRRDAAGASRPQKIVPDRLVAQRRDEGAMGVALGIGDPRRQRHLALPPRRVARCRWSDMPRVSEARMSCDCRAPIRSI